VQTALHVRVIWISLALFSWMCGPAWSQLPLPRLNRISPALGESGTTVTVSIAGDHLDEVDRLIFQHPGITAVPIPPNGPAGEASNVTQFQVTIAADVPAGVYEVLSGGGWGTSQPRRFAVFTRPQQLLEAPGRMPKDAVMLTPGTGVSTQLSNRHDVHWFRFRAQQGERQILECWGARLDSLLEAVMSVYDETGRRQIVRTRSTAGRDPVLVFDAPVTGDYLLKLHDVTYRFGEDYSYSVQIHSDPYLAFARPNVVSAGTRTKVTLYGYHLPGGRPSGLLLNQLELDALEVDLDAPERTSLHSTAVSTVDAPLSTFEYRLPVDQNGANALRLGLTSFPLRMESEATSQPLELPVTISGEFAERREEDRFRFLAQQGQPVSIQVVANRLRGLTDPVMTLSRVVTDAAGRETLQQISITDDSAPSLHPGFFETRSADPSLLFAPPETGVYQIALHDRFSENRGGTELQYHVTLKNAEPDFQVFAVPGAPSTGKTIPFGIRTGDRVPVTIYVNRLDGFTGAIQVRAEHLPPGIQCDGLTVRAGVNMATLMIMSSETVNTGWHPIQLVAEAVEEGVSQSSLPNREHPVQFMAMVFDNRGGPPAVARTTGMNVLSILNEPAPSRLEVESKSLTISQGDSARLAMTIPRPKSLPEAITFHLRDAPNGVTMEQESAPDGQARHEVTLRVGKEVPVGTYSFWIDGETRVQYQKNPLAIDRATNPVAVKGTFPSPTVILHVVAEGK